MLAHTQSGRYQGSSEAQEAFERGQAESSAGDRHLEEGDQRRAMRAYADAEEHYQDALHLDEEFEVAWERLGYVLYVMDRSDEAIEVLDEGLEQVPNSLMIRRMRAINLYQAGRTDQAVEALQTVDREGGATADALFLLGKHFYEANAYSDAITYFQRYLVETPSDAAIHGALGNCYLRTDQYDQALAAFRTVIELDPTNLAARINIGDVYFASADYERAVQIYELVLPNDDTNFRLWFNLGKSRFELGRFIGALEAFQRVTEIHPALYQGYYFSGVCHLELGEDEAALAPLRQALELEPNHTLSRYRLGLALAGTGQLDEAETSLRTARDASPTEPWFAWALGDVLRRVGRVDEAIALHEEAIESDDTQAAFHESLGRDHFAADNLVDARAALARSLNLEPDRSSAIDALTITLLTQARRHLESEALEDAEAAITRAEALGAYPLQTAIARASAQFLSDDLDGAGATLTSVPMELQDDPSYRRALAHLQHARGNSALISDTLASIAGQSPEELDPRDGALLGYSAAAGGDWERALALFASAHQQTDAFHIEVAIAHTRVGMLLGERGRWADARDHFDIAAASDDALAAENRARVHYARGVASLHLSEFDAARRYLADAGRLAARVGRGRTVLPSDAQMAIPLRLAYANYRTNRYAEAIELLAQVGNRDRDDAQRLLGSAQERLAMIAYEAGEVGRAREHLEAAVEVVPRDVRLLNNLACLQYAEGAAERAGDRFAELAQEGQPAIALFNYAVFLDEVDRDASQAYEYYSRYLDHGGPAEDEARRFADDKAAVFGFTWGE